MRNNNKKDYTFVNTSLYSPPKKREVKVPNRLTRVSDEELTDFYVKNVLWNMENPKNKGFNEEDGKYYSYTDKDSNGIKHINIGPGLEKTGHPNIDYSRGYTKEELDSIASTTVADRVVKMSKSLRDMNSKAYNETRDTLSLGPLLAITDIAYNVKTANRKNLPENWPSLIQNLSIGNLEEAKKHTYSGSKRRQKMRNDLLTYNPIDSTTVKNR